MNDAPDCADLGAADLAWAYQTIVGSAPVGIMVYRLEDRSDAESLRVVFANEAASAATQTDLQLIVGRPILDAFPNLQGSALLEAFREVVVSGEPASLGDVEYGDASIPKSTFETTATPLPPDHVVVAFSNVTELRATQRKLRHRTEQLEDALRVKEAQVLRADRMAVLGNLLAGIAHEMRTPLGAITSNNQVLTGCADKIADGVTALRSGSAEEPKALDSALSIMRTLCETNAVALERLDRLVNTLRRFGRADAEQPEAVDLAQLLQSTLSLVRHELKHRIDVTEEYGDVPVVQGYPAQLGQVFTNLLVNAAQAISGKGHIGICTCCDGDSVSVEIRDTGHGIAEENLGKIFEAGFTTKEASVGTGLGLALSLEIVRNHGGRIEVESTPEVGSTFRVLLPLAD